MVEFEFDTGIDILTIVYDRKVNRQTGEIKTFFKPDFLVDDSEDYMGRGHWFYALYNRDTGFWMTNEHQAIKYIDRITRAAADKYREGHPYEEVIPLRLAKSSTKLIDDWHHYCQKQRSDGWHQLDSELVFANEDVTKEKYCTHKMEYSLEPGECPAWRELLNTLYGEGSSETHKIEYLIGSAITGESKHIQKCYVFYGDKGTGKSTIMKIMQEVLFPGHCSAADTKELTSGNTQFPYDSIKDNKLLSIEHDAKLDKIVENHRLNSVISHEKVSVPEKYKTAYQVAFHTTLVLGSNNLVKITDSKSGLLRRLIDISPTGNHIPRKRYDELLNQIRFEAGAIAYHCKEVFEANPHAYDEYVPMSMIAGTNHVFDYIDEDYLEYFKQHDAFTLSDIYRRYLDYCEKTNILHPYTRLSLKEELKTYFREYKPRMRMQDGSFPRDVYIGFKDEMVDYSRQMTKITVASDEKKDNDWLDLKEQESLFDIFFADCKAQLANPNTEKPTTAWANVTTKLCDIPTSKIHYVQTPPEFIHIDLDYKDKNGNKDPARNIEEARKYKPTYAELSKGGGLHLTYLYLGDASDLELRINDSTEVKVSVGNSSLRRKLTKCNNVPIASISSGLPLKKEVTKGGKVVKWDGVTNSIHLRRLILGALKKQYGAKATATSISLIKSALDDAYERGISYDVSDLSGRIYTFAVNSQHQSQECTKLVDQMHFKSKDNEGDDPEETVIYEGSVAGYFNDERYVFFDVEVYPNLFMICWKYYGDPEVHVEINPTPEFIEWLGHHKLIGYNNRRYDNHMCIRWAELYGEENANFKLYLYSKKIINAKKGTETDAYTSLGWGWSYADIFDIIAEKKGLKWWEYKLKDKAIQHKEVEFDWDQPVPEEKWQVVAEYCKNDVRATEAVYEANLGDYHAREVLSDISDGGVNQTTNSHTTRFVFGKDKKPQRYFRYRNLAEPVTAIDDEMRVFLGLGDEPTFVGRDGRVSWLPYFPGYHTEWRTKVVKHSDGTQTEVRTKHSIYRGVEVGEGGFVYGNPGMYGYTVTLDVRSMHPNSMLSEYLFGKYTERVRILVNARAAIKHGDLEEAKRLLGPKAEKYLVDKKSAKKLDKALKIAINSIYGLTAAGFENPFRDPRNVDNIVAKRGALFMVDLKYEVEERGFNVVHIKTDSIKIENPSDEILQFCKDFARKYGYEFEIEHIFEKICLVNDAVYVAKCANNDPETPGEWTATGKQFQVPYVFKTLFSHEEVTFDDLCEIKNVSTALYLDFNEGLAEGEHNYSFVGKIGQFCPIKPGRGGGVLLRKTDNGFAAAVGSKGYLWMESYAVESHCKQDDIDMTYYEEMAETAKEDISKFGSFEWFVDGETNEEPTDRIIMTPPSIDTFMNLPVSDEEEVPFEESVPVGSGVIF